MRQDDRAVSEVIGTVLLVAVTVVMAGGFALLMANFAGPTDRLHADLDISINEGSGAWGTGDEEVVVEHRGGETIRSSETRIVVQIQATTYQFDGDQLGSAFSDGRFVIGERWVAEFQIQTGQDVTVSVIGLQGGGSSLSTAANLRSSGDAADCSADAVPPTVQNWAQTPSDLDAEDVASVTVQATLTDDCAGVDTTVNPHLEYRVNDGTGPAFTDTGAMARLSGATWQGTIPVPGTGSWQTHSGKTLEYRLTLMTDLNGNVGTSTTQADYIQDPASTTFTYPNDPPTVTTGSVSGYANLLNADDGDAAATFTEGAVTSSSAVVYAGSTTSGDATNPANADGSPDGTYAILVSRDKYVRVGGFVTDTGTIQYVELLATAHYEVNAGGALDNDRLLVSYLLSGSATGSSQAFTPTTSDGTHILNVTGDRTWTWSDIQNLQVEAKYQRNANDDGIDLYMDVLLVRVTTQTSVYELDVQMDFTAVPSGGQYLLQMEYQTSLDSFNVLVQQPGGTWQQRGTTLSSSSMTMWSYALTTDEYQSGSPKIRVVDASSTDSQGQILFDYVRVQTQ